jgi:hypothetical protein
VNHRPTLLARIALVAAVATATLTVSPAGATPASDAATGAVPPPTAADLAQTGPDQQRWLSVPESRIVLNPYDFNSRRTPVEQSTGPELPLSAGYYAGDEASTVRNLLSLYQRPAGEPPAPDIDVDFHDSFSSLSPSWSAEPGLVPTVADDQLHLTLGTDAPNAWGALSRELTLDVDAYPQVQITVTGAEAAWALKVTDGTQPVDTILQGDTHQEGTFTYDLAEATGWTGTKTFQVRLFAVGKGQRLDVDDLRIQSKPVPWLRSAETFSTTWLPHALPFTASYGQGGKAKGQDFFHDENSITRSLSFTGLSTDGGAVQIAGAYAGPVSFDRDQRTLTVEHEHYRYAVAVPAADAEIAFYASENDLIAGGPTLSEPGRTGFWALTVAPGQGDTSLATQVGIGFAPASDATVVAGRRARDAATRAGADVDPRHWERYWDRLLSRVPRPHDFAVSAVDDRGVPPADVRATYYRAWVFLAADVLPPEPEVGYDHPQLAAGKPSMWNFGAHGARASASWDSLLGMQYLAYVDPETAWRSYTGLMSLVDDDGMLGGESLPSRKAQTAWILYALTGDTARLRAIYPDLRRHLLWARANPRWIFGDHDDQNERDAEFVVSLLLDFGYAGRIAAALGEAEEVEFWQGQYDTFFADYLRWFWETPTSPPRQYYFLDTGAESPGNTLWVTTGLHLPTIAGDHLEGLKKRFTDRYDAAADFGGFGFPDVKAPDVTWTTYGLLEQGMTRQAAGLVDAVLRDMVRSGEFAEVYQPGPNGPEGTGVRPSLFGAVNVLDAVWLRNGYRMDAGDPRFVLLGGSMEQGADGRPGGGVDGLRIRGRTLNLHTDGEHGQVHLSGSYVRDHPSCTTLDAPVGETVQLPAGCATVRD